MSAGEAPELLPERGPSVWLGPRVDLMREGTRAFAAHEIAEIEAALGGLRAAGDRDFPEITRDAFPLPTLGPAIQRIGDDLRHGRGFLLLRGLPAARYDPDDLARILYGLGAHLGRALPQSHLGELVGHVMNVSDVEPEARGYHTGRALGPHSDNCDIVALMCIRPGAGGRSRIISAAAIHNLILRRRPDLLAALYLPVAYRRKPKDAELGSGVRDRSVATFSRASGELSSYLNIGYVRAAIRADPASVPRHQVEALELLRRLLAAPEAYLEMEFQPGDIQLLNNRRIFHGRTGYDEPPAFADRRHLLRLWLAMPGWPPLPANQGMHDAADHAAWLIRREPFMELPSRYLAALDRRKAEASA